MSGVTKQLPGCVPPAGTPPGSRHWLRAYDTRTEFVWVGDGWSTPGTSYNTSPTRMYVLGWRYDADLNLQNIPSGDDA